MTDKVYLVVSDSDPGFSAPKILGVFTTREAADKEAEARGVQTYDGGVIELVLDESTDTWVKSR